MLRSQTVARALLLTLLVLGGCGPRPSGPGPLTHKPPPDDGAAARGTLAGDQVRKVIQQYQGGFNLCFEKSAGSFVSGDATLTFVVGRNGRVDSVWVSDADLGSWRIEDCLLSTAKHLEFPPPSGDDSARFAYPFTWNPAGARLSNPVDASFGYETLRAHRREIRRCREEWGFRGPFHLTIYVGRLGKVLSAGFHSSKPPREGFSACVVQLLDGVRFPDPGPQVVKFQALVEDLPTDDQ